MKTALISTNNPSWHIKRGKSRKISSFGHAIKELPVVDLAALYLLMPLPIISAMPDLFFFNTSCMLLCLPIRIIAFHFKTRFYPHDYIIFPYYPDKSPIIRPILWHRLPAF
jgi:hypothetical protein